MKKKRKVSAVFIVLLAIIAILALYYFFYFVPTASQLGAIRADTAVYHMEADTYRPYVNDPAILEGEIAQVQAELDDLKNNGFVNQAEVNLVIGDAIQRYAVNLTSQSLSNETTFGELRVLPINLVVTGEFQNILDFISHFENNATGSYLVQAASLETNGSLTSARIVIYLCMPMM